MPGLFVGGLPEPSNGHQGLARSDGANVGCMTTFSKALGRAAALLAALGLVGCAGASSDFAGSMMVAPGSYNAYDCVQLEQTERVLRGRIAELEQLMARASKGAGGDFVNAISYRSDYEYARGQHAEVMRTAANKNCPAQSKWSSQRSLF